MTAATTLYGPVTADLPLIEDALARVKAVEYEPLRRMLEHILAGGGKRVRPALALLAGRFGDYDLAKLVPLAASIELLHTATLVHDDVIDKSPLRRGLPTAHSLFGNAASVMVGDFMFAHAADLVASTDNVPIVRLFARTIMALATGELAQDVSAFDYRKTIQEYYARIGGKTASLFAAATEGGALITGCPPRWVTAMRDYGFNYGMAFQIVDDILDFTGSEAALGKPAGGDLLSGTLTLPSLLLMERAGAQNPVRRFFLARRNREQRLAEVLEAVRDSGVLDESAAVARDFANRALGALDPLPAGSTRVSLADLAEFVLSRGS